MKKIFILILPLLLSMFVVFLVFGFILINVEKEKSMNDIKRKTKVVAESIEESAIYILVHKDFLGAKRIVDKFEKRKVFQGCVIYDDKGKIIAITNRITEWGNVIKPYISSIIINKTPEEYFGIIRNYTVYSYAIPLLDNKGNLLGIVEILYDSTFIVSRINEIKKHIAIAFVISSLLIIFISYFIQKRIFIEPVGRIAKWFKEFQKGEILENNTIKEEGELGNLAKEIEQIALKLKVAKKNFTEEARKRINKDELWTEEKLRDLVHAKLGENSLFIVSNREPYMHVSDEKNKKIKCIRPASGVVSAIDPIMRACNGIWIAHGSGNADKKFVNSKDKLGVPPDNKQYILKRVWLTKEEEEGYYYGFSNEGLWPLCHITHTRPLFREQDWEIYKNVNEKFAESIIEELPTQSPFIFIHDYHFTLLPKIIKEKRPDAKIAIFWHIPWPHPEVFSICPYRREILDGMLGCDIMGFHIQNHCNNFLDTVNKMLEARTDMEKFSVVRNNKETLVRAFPISVDTNVSQSIIEANPKQIEDIYNELELKGKTIVLSVERIDYTKGIIERIHAIDKFFEKYPKYKNQVVFIQIAAPSRTHIKRYHDLTSEIEEVIEKTNWKYNNFNWKPIIYLKDHFSYEDIVFYYVIADICIVSSLHDGMNLVAKEYIAAKNGTEGALILSCFTGASRELTDAIEINPYFTGEFADKIKDAIEMPPKEKKQRMENMLKIINENNIYKWAGNIITELTSLKDS